MSLKIKINYLYILFQNLSIFKYIIKGPPKWNFKEIMNIQKQAEKVILSLDTLKNDLIDYLAAKKANQKVQQLEFKLDFQSNGILEEENETSNH